MIRLLVRCFDRVDDLLRDREGLVNRKAPTRDPVRECWPVDELEDERPDMIRFLEAVNRSDVRIVQRGEGVCFRLEASEPVGIDGERFGEHLERNVAI